jgi:cephalosporin-C deacetylase
MVFKIKLHRLLHVAALILMFCQCGILSAYAQPKPELVTVKVSADHKDWVYKPGEKVKFLVNVFHKDTPLEDVKINYEVGPEKMPPVIKDSTSLINGKYEIYGGTMDKPGFLRCLVSVKFQGKTYRGLATAAFSPELLRPTTNVPTDFKEFWDKAKAENAKIPMDPKLRLLPERSNDSINVYEISVQNFEPGSRVYGVLCVPKKTGKYPAILTVPGAGVGPKVGDLGMAARGFITLQIGIHGISVTMPDSVYKRLATEEKYKRYRVSGIEDRDKFYFKRVFLGCVRAIDFLYSLPEFDGQNLAVAGGSQGGALTIVTTALDNRVKYLVAFAPAMCDLTGYLHDRAGGWPHTFNAKTYQTKNRIETSKYYDVANFAQFIKVPGFYSWGFNDETCPPTSMYSAYNVITAPKELFIAKDAGHWYYPLQNRKKSVWLVDKLIKK